MKDEKSKSGSPGGRPDPERRQRIVDRVNRRLDQTLQPLIVARRTGDGDSGLESIGLQWRGDHLVLLALYVGSSVAQAQPFGRISPTADGLFDLAYRRHSGKWASLARACTLGETLAYFDLPSPLWPRELIPCDAPSSTPGTQTGRVGGSC